MSMLEIDQKKKGSCSHTNSPERYSTMRVSLNAEDKTRNNLEKIVYAITDRGPTDLSARAIRYFWWVVAAARIGQWSITGYCAAIAAAIYRTQGQTRSIRTLRSALREVEAAGYVTVRPATIGIRIDIDRNRMAWWTGKTYGNVTPLVTLHTVDYSRQTLPTEDRMSNNTNDPSDLYQISSKLLTNSKNRANKNYTSWIHPIIFTLRVLLRGAQDRFGLEVLAKSEISGETELTEIPWDRYSAEWQRLPISEREGIARTWFLPGVG